MIRTLTINNIALIEHISVHFHHGLNVLSGETGAGKSIIVDAVALILGGRADRDLIRSGCDRASVEAEFEAEDAAALSVLFEREQIEWHERTVLIYREISQSGRNICRINGIVVTLSVLKEAASFLLNLHGQSEHQFLADTERHIFYLDLMGDSSHQQLLQRVQDAYNVFIANHRAYAKLVKMNESKEIRLDYLSRELDELHRIALQSGEEQKLNEKVIALHKSSRIHEKICHAVSALSNSEDGMDALAGLQTAAKDLRSVNSDDGSFSKIADQCDALYFSLEEILYSINELKRKYDYNPDELDHVEKRLDSVHRVLAKYGPSEDDALVRIHELENEYEILAGLDSELKHMGIEHKQLLAAYRSAARDLTDARKRIAAAFEQQMMTELKDLGMDQTVFSVLFSLRTDGKPIMPSANGDDCISFMFSPNPGEPLKSISSIASGGELSRLMLAIKTIESGRSGFQTMIFDEIDTGISGRMAQAVAEKMIMISRRQQVICISHLPQIAAAADHHYLIYKGVKGGRTFTEASELTATEHINEVARMISGAQGITEDAKHYADLMIAASHETRK